MRFPRRYAAGAVSLTVAAFATLALAGASNAWTLNEVQLDNGTCSQNLQMGSDKTLSTTATPSFVISGDGGASSYRIFIDGNLLGTFISDGWGNVCVYTTVPLAQGRHDLTGVELAPHPTYTVIPFNFGVDSLPPAPPSTPALGATTDTGVLGDGITSTRNAKLVGTAEPNMFVHVYKGAAIAGGTKADAAGNWSITTATLADGTYTMKAAALDDASNRSAFSANFMLTIDGTAPAAPAAAPSLSAASDTAPVGDNATTVATPTVTGSAATGVATIRVFSDSVQVGTAIPDAAGAWSFSLPTLTVGGHTITAKAADAAANMSVASAALSLTILAGAPSATAPGAPSLNSATAGNGTVTLAWSAPASNGGSAVTGYKIYRGTTSGGATYFGTVGTILTWTDTTVTNGTTYYYQVSAVNAVGESTRSAVRSATPTAPATAPGAPGLNSATAGNGSVTLAWSAPPSNGGSPITGYKIYRGTTSSGATYFGTVGTALGWTDTTVSNGTTYYYQVTAINTIGESSRSAVRSATPTGPATAPGAPSLNSATAGNATVALAWSAPASTGGSPITGYKIYRGTTSGGATYFGTVGTGLGWTDTTVTNGTTYYYQVTAINTIGESTRSVVRSATPTGPTSVPGAPSLNSATAGNATVALAWSAPASTGGSPITGYKIYRGTTSGGATYFGTVGTGLGWTDTTVTNGTTYYYQVTAINTIGESTRSVVRSATPTGPTTGPSAPSLISAVPGHSVTLTWSAPATSGSSPVTGYRIYRGTTSGAATLLTSVGVVTTYLDTTTINGTTYYFQVSAVTAAGEGARSNELSATPMADTTPPSKPSGMKALVTGTSQIILGWSASIDNTGVTGYQLYRNATLLTTVTDPARTFYLDNDVTPGGSYSYYVRAMDAAGNLSVASSTVNARAGSLSTSTVGMLAGAVLDATGRPMDDVVVTITLPTGPKTTKTNSSGIWKLSNLPPGTYAVTFALAGYPPQTLNLTSLAGRTMLSAVVLPGGDGTSQSPGPGSR